MKNHNRVPMGNLAVILGSAYRDAEICGEKLVSERVETPFGSVDLFQHESGGWVIFRHGMPHKYLPNQIPYQAYAFALKKVGCQSLLVTSSVGVLNPKIPLDTPLIISDLVMVENRLPDGSACTMFTEESEDQGHLVLKEGLFSKDLSRQLRKFIMAEGYSNVSEAVFAYAMGPRSKTAAENAMYAGFADINSMTLAPEVVLAGELEISVAGLAIGHKYSLPQKNKRVNETEIDEALEIGREKFDKIVLRFLKEARPVEFKNQIYRY